MVNDGWVYAQRKVGEYPEHTSRGGKWLIFVSGHSLHIVWEKIRVALERGKLGGLAKASTMKCGLHAPGSKHGVICVYTYDWRDREDVKRIREELRKIGITRKIPYKTDEDTERDIYRSNNSGKMSKYYE